MTNMIRKQTKPPPPSLYTHTHTLHTTLLHPKRANMCLIKSNSISFMITKNNNNEKSKKDPSLSETF